MQSICYFTTTCSQYLTLHDVYAILTEKCLWEHDAILVARRVCSAWHCRCQRREHRAHRQEYVEGDVTYYRSYRSRIFGANTTQRRAVQASLRTLHVHNIGIA